MEHVALITGANGFVGRVLSAHLASQNWRVLESVIPGVENKAGQLPCDITSKEQVTQLMEQARGVTHVFHLAAITFVPLSSAHPAETMAVNVLGTVNLLHAMLVHHPKARFVFVGSAAIYGAPQWLPVTEDHPLAPREPYAISKTAADAYCEYAARALGADVVRLRPFNHSGAGQSDRFVLSNFARQIVEIERGNKPPILRVGNLDASRDFLHVNDVVRAYELAALGGTAGDAYNVCSGRGTVIRDALGALLRRAQVSITVETDPDRLRPLDIPEVWGTHERLTNAVAWRPETPFETVLDDLMAYWRNNL
jgi:GDP-4-dehydro-6-deoxy-D-mannose reductase